MINNIEKYTIETNIEISIVREKIDTQLNKTHNFFTRKFVGLIQNDSFQGSIS